MEVYGTAVLRDVHEFASGIKSDEQPVRLTSPPVINLITRPVEQI